MANFLRSESILAVERLLQRGERFDAIYAQSDSMATGARLALRRFGIDPASIPIIGIDYIEEARAAIRRGEQSVSYTYPTGGKEGAQVVIDLLAGRPVVKEQIIRSVKVTADNVERVEPIF